MHLNYKKDIGDVIKIFQDNSYNNQINKKGHSEIQNDLLVF